MRFPILMAALLATQAAFAADREVTDSTGRTVLIPDSPARIVVLHEPLLGLPLLDLGLSVAGSYGRTDDGRVLTAVDFIDTVFDGRVKTRPSGIGAVGQMDLEKLRKLDPDLIIGTERDREKVDQLSTIAPVYLQTISSSRVPGFGVEGELAALLGRSDVFAARKGAYLDRASVIRAGLPDGGKERTYLAVILNDQINLVGDMSGAIAALRDLGYRPADVARTGAASGSGSTFAVPLDTEAFARLNPDLLVVMMSYASKDRSEEAIKSRLDKIMPGWTRFLKPARDGRILFLDSAKVATPTVASAEHTLDAYEAWARR